ncbi:MAG: DUF2892 domain-containing protein [candidate division Zixibacteria bacterium]|jgi:DNA-binding helix-hairpin-helix protein with protein kinase domain|nr:DUF2892 domain-containing protein [candidate division Zixibacteria bacterium]
MTLEHSIRILAGTLILASVALAYFVSPWWHLVTIFVGFNLVQSSFTKFCPAEMIFKKLFFSGRKEYSGQTENA